jgi:hypothetical protein
VTARAHLLAMAVVALAALLPWSPSATAEVRASLEPSTIDEFDTTRLVVRVSGTHEAVRLDLSALEADFEVLTTQSASQYRSVNGRVESWVEYQIMLRPKRAGELTVPPIRIGGDHSDPVTLTVRAIAPDLRDTIDRMVFFETELTADPVYVQAQTVLIRRLFYVSGAQIYSDLPGLPEIADAVVVPLGETTSTTTVRDGQRYGVVEQRFAIFPEQSGELTVPAISVTSSVRFERDGRVRRSGVRIATEPMTIEVLPIPPEYPADEPWLPAENLLLEDDWTPAGATVQVGEPLRRSLRATVTGNVSSAIPPLEAALPDDQFRRYPEPPELEDDPRGSSLRGSRVQSYAVMPTAPGAVTLPQAELVWWDVNRREVRTARAPGKAFRVTGSAATQAPPSEPAESAAALPPPVLDTDVRQDQVPWPGPQRRRMALLVTLGVVAAGLLLYALGRWLGHRPWRRWRPRWLPSRTAARAALPAERAAWQTLRQACRSGDPTTMHRALQDWLRARFRTSKTEAVARFRAAGHGPLLDRLSAACYGRASAGTPSGGELLRAAKRLRRSRVAGRWRRVVGHRGSPLPALYD